MRVLITLLVWFSFLNTDISGQNEIIMPDNKNMNPLLCSPETGICQAPGHETNALYTSTSAPVSVKPVHIIYFTDPICSSCWGIEPQLRKLKMEYGNLFEIEYRMGGLLKDWSYNSGGISKPSDVAHHWDEVSAFYKMPIDGDIWLEDPLDSSFPPSIAFKAAQMQNEEKAVLFLRVMREMVFLEKKNITRWEFIKAAANAVGLDTDRLRSDYERDAEALFLKDMDLAKQYGVRGFPTLIFSDREGNQFRVYGFKPYDSFESALLKIVEDARKTQINTSPDFLFEHFNTLTTREFSELSALTFAESEKILAELLKTSKLKQRVTKNGVLWEKTRQE